MDNKGLGKGMISLIVAALLVIILLLYFVSGYNRFVKLDQDVNAKWSEVESQYQRQADLIPNLVSVTSSSVKAETAFVKDVIAARNAWRDAVTVAQKDSAGVAMSNGVAAFVNAVAEQYPTFQANKQYTSLTDELAGTANRITVARGRYIQTVQEYNTAIKRFPSNIIAGMFGFSSKDYYKADASSLNTPQLGSGELP
ncbi:MAG: LemA family protein [Nanoarchaeota archaeon]